MEVPATLQERKYCYLSTQGRVTGRSHTAELWFVPTEGGVYLMSGSGGLTQWCLNLQSEEQAVVRIDDRSWLGRAAVVGREDEHRDQILREFHSKYDPPHKSRYEPWRRSATVVHLVFMRELVHD